MTFLSGLAKIFKRVKARQKLLISYFLLIVLPLGIFTTISYINSYYFVNSMVEEFAGQSFDQAGSFLANYFKYAVEVSEAIILNDGIKRLSNLKSEEQDVFEQMGDVIYFRMIREVFSEFKDIYNIRFYLDNSVFYIDDYQYFNLNDFKNTDWYKRLKEAKGDMNWVYFSNNDLKSSEKPTISLVRFLTDPNDYQQKIGILRIDILETDIRKILINASSAYSTITYIQNHNNKIFSLSVDNINPEWKMNYKELLSVAKKQQQFKIHNINENSFLLGCQLIPYSNLLLVTMIPQNEILKNSIKIRNDMFLMLLLVSITAGIFAYLLSSSRIKRRNFELMALQGQINPHFLYNTLDLINWTAMEHGISEISSLVISLSKFYKLSLNKGSEIISLEDELEHVNLYIEIQNKRMDNGIELFMDIDERIYEYTTIKTILQPIVENAVLHGIMKKESKQGIIVIYGMFDKEDIIITVHDDGVGIKEEELAELRLMSVKSSNGYGIINIDKRIKLHYGNKYGLTIDSVEGEGTTVTVRIPALKEN